MATRSARDPATVTDGDAAPARGAPASVELVGAGRAFGDFSAVELVSLSVRPGERVAILGPSGAGKSTLLRLVNTSLFATSGAVRILGVDVAALSPRALRGLRARIGTVYQGLQLVPQASVLENVLMGGLGRRSALAVAAGALRRRDREEARAVLERVGIPQKLDERLDRLSGGEQQRVAVARVLYQAPDLVVADEPFSAVDPERSHAVVRLLIEAARGRTLILSTHQLEPILPHFPRIVGLRAGRVLFDKEREAVTAEDLARLYQPEEATPSPEPRRLDGHVGAPFDSAALRSGRAEGEGAAPPGAARAEGEDDALPGAGRAEEGAQGELRLGASTTPGEHILPAVAALFARGNPRVQVRLTVKDTGAVLADLAAGRVELAFVGARSGHPDLHFEDFAEDEIVLVASPAFGGVPAPLTPSLAARLPRVDREPGSATRAIVEAQLAGMGAALDPAASVLEAGSVAALRSAVAAGMGVGWASRRSVEADLRAGRLREVAVEQVQIPRRFFVAWRRASALSSEARRFLEAARAHAGDRP